MSLNDFIGLLFIWVAIYFGYKAIVHEGCSNYRLEQEHKRKMREFRKAMREGRASKWECSDK